MYTNTLTGGVLLAGGDLIEQEIESRLLGRTKNSGYDLTRTARMFAVGLLGGPAHHYWYTFLDRAVPHKSLRAVGAKILADQVRGKNYNRFIYLMHSSDHVGKCDKISRIKKRISIFIPPI